MKQPVLPSLHVSVIMPRKGLASPKITHNDQLSHRNANLRYSTNLQNMVVANQASINIRGHKKMGLDNAWAKDVK